MAKGNLNDEELNHMGNGIRVISGLVHHCMYSLLIQHGVTHDSVIQADGLLEENKLKTIKDVAGNFQTGLPQGILKSGGQEKRPNIG